MSFLQLAALRHSVRKFSSRAVESDKLSQVLAAGRLAPTACNLQPQRIFVLQSPAAIAAVRASTECHFSAPMFLLICYEASSSWLNPFTKVRSGETDAAIVTTHMILAAAELGLGTTWVGYFRPEPLIEFCQLPEGVVPLAILPLGYPDDTSRPSDSHATRKPLSETVSYK